MKTFMKSLSLLLSLMLLCGIVPLAVFNASAVDDATIFTSVYLSYRITSDTAKTAEVTGFSGLKQATITIPSTVTNKDTGITYNVTSVGDSAFYDCDSLESVIISSNVKTIKSMAFDNCTRLITVTLGEDVETIGYDAFYNCGNLAEVNFTKGNNIKYLDDYAFSKCKLKSIDLPNILKIGVDAFANCTELETVTLGNNLTYIGDWAFTHCEKLKSIDIPNSVTFFGMGIFNFCISLEHVTLSNNLQYLGDGEFYLCEKLKSINIPNSVKGIGSEAFWGCYELETVTIGNGVRFIDKGAFYNCKKLKTLNLYTYSTTIRENAFDYKDTETNTEKQISGIKFYSYEGSTTQDYATKNGFAFDLLPKQTQTITGATSYTKTVGDSDFYLNCSATTGLTYKSDYEKVANVTSEGRVTIIGTGTATITVTAVSTPEYEAATKKITVKVNPKPTKQDNNTQATGNKTVKKASPTITVKPTAKTLKAKKLKKKAQSFKLSASVNSNAMLKFKKASGHAKISVNNSGKITVKKGLKKGTYKFKVKISAGAKGNYNAGNKTVTVKITVK